MKKVLLSLLLLGSVSTLMAQNPRCPIDIKSNQGGGSCDDFQGLKGTAVVTLTFSAPVACPPMLVAVTDRDNMRRVLKSGAGVVRRAPNNDQVEYCFYGETSADNFFNQPGVSG
jgi:hypothetical protein